MSGSSSYKPSDRCSGDFRCPKCHRFWSSVNSWPNMGQKCQSCEVMVYPEKQGPLKKPGFFDYVNPAGVHDQSRCEKCKQLGYSCRAARRY